MKKAFLIAVGSELLLPGREDTNTPYLRARLYERGFRVEGVALVGDDESSLVKQFEFAARRSVLVVATGGLGPTVDDVTKKALSRLLKKPPRYDEGIKRKLEQYYASRNMRMPDNCLTQAMIPVGGRALENPVGSAPGVWVEEHGCVYVLLPGPPKEMEQMFEKSLTPLLQEKYGTKPIFQRRLRLTGITESMADQAAAPIYDKFPDVGATILSKPGDVEFILTLKGDDAPQRLEKMVAEFQEVLGSYIYSDDGRSMEEVLAGLLLSRKLTLSTAESCTGGLLSKRLTDVPGASAFFLGGSVCYHNSLKTSMADVPVEVIEKCGAVSSTTASAMADGIRRRTGSRASIAVTGVAGPGGGTEEKPVGTVYVAVCLDEKTVAKKFRFHGDRDRVRSQAAQMSMEILRRVLA